MVDADELINGIKPKIEDSVQEQRIRDLYGSVTAAFELERAQGVKKVLDAQWKKIKGDFDSALGEVKKNTGLY